MTVSRRKVLFAGAAAVPAAALAAVAQQPLPAGQSPRAGQAGQQLGEDPFLAACLFGGGKRQIEVSRFALEKLSDAEVKQFARAEITEHETVKAELAKLGYTPPAPAAGGQPVQPAGGAVPAQGGQMAGLSVGRATLSPGVSQVVMIDGEVVDTCIANTKAMLTKCEQKGKTKFDKAYVGDQIHEHMGLLDKVTVFQRHATPEMQPVLKTAEQTIRQHIATCETLMERLEMAALREMQGGQRPGGNGQ